MGSFTKPLGAALHSQFDRRGSDWLLKKGGLSRIDEKIAKKIVKALENGSFNVEKCEKMLAPIPSEEQMVLLNLLGGKLPIGWRLCGAKASQVGERVLTKSDRTFRRIKRVAETLEKIISNSNQC